jgi:YD repeat-containing protein
MQNRICIIQATLNNLSTSDANMRIELNKLRVGLPCAMIYTYTYKPLIGMTGETSPKGRTTYYEYDDLGRLTVVRDHDLKILREICYNYAGQVENCVP